MLLQGTESRTGLHHVGVACHIKQSIIAYTGLHLSEQAAMEHTATVRACQVQAGHLRERMKSLREAARPSARRAQRM